MSTLYPQPTARQLISMWVESQLIGRDEIVIADLVKDAYDEFTDEQLIQIGRESLHEAVITQTRKVIARTRSPFRPKPMKFAVLDEHTRKQGLVWEKFMEWTGRGHVRLMAMTPDQLNAAASIRSARGEREIGYAILWSDLASALQPEQHVGDVFSAEDIAKKAMGITVEVEGRVLTWTETLEKLVDDNR